MQRMASKITVRALEIHWIRLKRLPEVSSIASGKKRFGSPSFFCTKCRTGGHKCKVSLAPCGTSLHSRPCIFLSAPEIEHATQSATLCSKIVEKWHLSQPLILAEPSELPTPNGHRLKVQVAIGTAIHGR